jgi:hypothetical protein
MQLPNNSYLEELTSILSIALSVDGCHYIHKHRQILYVHMVT